MVNRYPYINKKVERLRHCHLDLDFLIFNSSLPQQRGVGDSDYVNKKLEVPWPGCCLQNYYCILLIREWIYCLFGVDVLSIGTNVVFVIQV